MKLGIAFGGGGAKGFAHLGVMKVLADAGIEFDCISGTSIGAIVGAAYANQKLEVLEQIARSIRLHHIPGLFSPTLSRKGFFSGRKAVAVFLEAIGIELIEDLPKPFVAISADINREQIVVFRKGSLADALRASMSLPGVFVPVPQGDQLLVDGGTLEPVPVQAALDLGSERVLAIDLFGHLQPLGERLSKGHYWFRSVFERTLAVNQRSMTASRFREFPADVIVAPEVDDISMFDFHKAIEVIERGVQAGKKALPRIREAVQ